MPGHRPVAHLRWWIGGLLFASTVINYIDRQTLNVLAPYLKADYHWTNSDFALIVIAFRLSYAVVQFVGGRFIDYCRDAARADDHGGVVFGDGHGHLIRDRAEELLRVSISAGRGRGGELAGRNQGGVGMVSRQGAWYCGGAVR